MTYSVHFTKPRSHLTSSYHIAVSQRQLQMKTEHFFIFAKQKESAFPFDVFFPFVHVLEMKASSQAHSAVF